MKNDLWCLCLLAAAVASAGCGASRATPSPSPRPTPARAAADEPQQPRQLEEFFVEGDSLSHEGYEVSKRSKVVRVEGPAPEDGVGVEVSYAVVKRGGRVLAKFDGVYSGFGNATSFGLFPFLGGGAKQLAVSQTVPRGGRHWVVDLSASGPRVIHDSSDFGTGREEFGVIDLDGDGVYEISQPLTAFYYTFEDMGVAETPLPEIVFKYDARAGRYLPANPLFRAYVLGGVEDDIRRLDPDGRPEYLSSRLGILLRYVYAGQEPEGWAFFEREYRRADRDEVKAKVKAELRRQPAYRFISRKF